MLTSRGAAVLVCSALLLLGGWQSPACAQDETDPTVAETTARIAELTELVGSDPENIELLIDLGNLYYENNMLDQALAAYERAASVDSTHAGAHLNLGAVLSDMGDFQRAIEELNRASELEPENALILSTLGSAYYGRSRFAEAFDMYQLALSLDPRSVEAHFNLGVAFADAQMFDEAIREWQEVMAIDPDGPVAQICRDNIQMMSEFLGK